MPSRKEHWEKIYATKSANELSWSQSSPKTSLEFIHGFKLPLDAPIIDVGGGDSLLVDYLLAEGYTNITVLDISAAALDKVKARLGAIGRNVNWIVADIMDFQPAERYAVWHDRATFHFLSTESELERYIALARRAVRDNGYLTIGTFSAAGPDKCSGLAVRKYSEQNLSEALRQGFEKLRCFTEDHITPFRTIQNFLFCSFQRRLQTG